jgi:integrase
MRTINRTLAHLKPPLQVRRQDAAVHPGAALFLAAATVVNSSAGRLIPKVINTVWNEVCRLARIRGKTPHAARHAMGRHIMNKTGNVAAVQRQLGHKKGSLHDLLKTAR